MAGIEEELLSQFYDRLAADDQVSDEAVEQLRQLLKPDAKLKAEDFVRVFDPPSEEDLP